jgi:hypothetical protein
VLHDTSKIRVLALLLGLVFLAAQFHFCADLTSANSTSHFCPFCATAGSAIATALPTIGLAPANAQVDFVPTRVLVSPGVWYSISPRAPPSL